MSLALRLLLALAYPFLAHAASARADGTLAALALADVVVFMLLDGLLERRVLAWAMCVASLAALAWWADSPWVMALLLLVPVAFIAMIGWVFARTLLPGRTALITRLVAALDRLPAAQLPADLYIYTRRLTALWAVALTGLLLGNLVLALIAQPRGLLAMVHILTPFQVTELQWAWLANWLNYGLVGGLMVGEYLYRKWRFPRRYKNLADFVHRLVGLGPAFWRDFLR